MATEREGAGGLIIVVEDDAAVLGALSFAFETEGFAVRGYRDAEALLAAPPEACVCLVCDHKLPGMSGLDLIERLRAQGRAAPVILITTNPSPATLRRAKEAGVEIVEKPLLGEALAARVREAIRHAAAPA